MVRDLRQAQINKKDEFYTSYEDIEKELVNYKDTFKNKVVYCNCDDPETSNFTKFFMNNFKFYKLKKLICTHFEANSPSYKLIYTGNGSPKTTPLKQNFLQTNMSLFEDTPAHSWSGDFRSSECIELLKEADIVVTNPPFSLFREFVNQLVEYNKKFIIIGNQNALSYKEIFPLVRDKKLWLGESIHSGDREFQVPDDYPLNAATTRVENGKKYIRIKGIRWFTNIDYTQLHDIFPMISKKQNELNDVVYQKYENFNGIEVPRTKYIPFDYKGIMGVPITFMDKYNPDQFEIVGLGIANLGLEIGVKPYKPEHKKYRKEIQHKGTVNGDLYLLDEEGHPKVPYARILIKNKMKYDEFGIPLEG